MKKNRIIPGKKYLHHRKIIIGGRQLEAERWIQCLEITGTGAGFRHEFEVMELTDKEIREQIVS